MRRIKYLMLGSLIWMTANGQQRGIINSFNDLQSPEIIDSFRKVLVNPQTDFNRIHALHRLTYPLLFSSPDSAMMLAQEGLKSSVSIGYKKGESLCRTDIAAIWWILGDYPKATLLMLENLKLTEQLDDPEAMEWYLSFLLTVCRNQGGKSNHDPDQSSLVGNMVGLYIICALVDRCCMDIY